MIKLRGWFTLVELLVVVTILSILAAVWFVSYSSYLTWARDTARVSELSALSHALIIYGNENPLPSPDNHIKILSWSKTLWLQWYLAEDTIDTIEYRKEWLDPLDKRPYHYLVSKSKQNHQLMAFLEKDKTVAFNLLNTSLASEYDGRFPYFEGQNLWILTDDKNTPIHELPSIQSIWNIDVATTTDTYTVHFWENDTISWNQSVLKFLWNVEGRKGKYCTAKRGIIECPFQKAPNVDEYCKSTFYRWNTNQALLDSPSWKICIKAWKSWISYDFNHWPWQSKIWWNWCYAMINNIKYWDWEKEILLEKDSDISRMHCFTRNDHQPITENYFILSENSSSCVRESIITDSKICAQGHGKEEKIEGIYY